MIYYKALSADGRSCHGGHSKWSLPVLQPDGTYKPGRWMPPIKDIEPCERGYHLFERKDIWHWLNATLYEAEGRGACIDHGNKVVFASARLLRPLPGCNERTLRLFACRVAEDVLPLWEQQFPNDDRPRRAIETVRRYADGEATADELAAEADAAWDAVLDTAWAARLDTVWRYAAWAAARAAALDTAWAAALDTAWAAGRDTPGAAASAVAFDRYTQWLWEMIEGPEDADVNV